MGTAGERVEVWREVEEEEGGVVVEVEEKESVGRDRKGRRTCVG